MKKKEEGGGLQPTVIFEMATNRIGGYIASARLMRPEAVGKATRSSEKMPEEGRRAG